MKSRIRVAAACFVLLAAFCQVRAAEYFVNTQGNDANDGRSRGSAFLTVQRGVDALEPGDTLTVGPGEYFEAVYRENLGSANAETVIRAEIPGTALLRGDVPAPAFEPVEGYRYVHKARFDQDVQAVNEADTLQILQARPNVAAVEFNPGTFHYDADSKTLYVSASDLESPDKHHYTVSVLESRGGILLKWPERVAVEGMAVTGFHASRPLGRMKGGDTQSDTIPWGVYVWLGKNCVVRETTTYLNAGGIGLISRDRGHNLVEDCVSYGNYSQFSVGTANVFGNRVNHDVFRGNYAYVGRDHGVRFHGGGEDSAGLMERNMSWGHSGNDVQVKGVANYELHHMAALGTIVGRSRYSLMSQGDSHPSNIVLGGGVDPAREFADPANLDFRLQATSSFRGAGPDGTDRGPFPYKPNIFFVSPQGDDGADGLSVETAWRTPQRALRRIGSGDTLYLEAGAYEGDLRISAGGGNSAAPARILSRGVGRAGFRGNVTIESAANIELERLDFVGGSNGGVTVRNSRAIRLNNCRFAGPDLPLRVEGTRDLRVTQCEFTGFASAALDLQESSGAFLRGNIYDNAHSPAVRVDSARSVLYSDYNSYAGSGAVWAVAGKSMDVEGLRQAQFDRYSRLAPVDYTIGEAGAELADPHAFAVGGPLGRAYGVHVERQRYGSGRVLRVDGPRAHSVTATTANIEWWSSHPSVFRVRWGRTPEMENSQTLTMANAFHPSNPLENFNTFSLNGLEPNTQYYVEIEHVGFADGGEAESTAIDNPALSFATLASDPAPRTLYVAADGDDSASGLSRQDAWRTINRAADQVRPGDTVLIGEGVYRETVRVRVTGDEGARIAFRAHPGEKVVMNGADNTLEGAFWLFNNKDFIDIDGLYLTDFMRGGPGSIRYGAIGVLRSRSIRLTRLFHYRSKPEIITIASSEDVLVRNCATIGGWDGIGVGGSTNVRIENNVIVRPSIRCVPVTADDPDDVLVRNNVITDNIRSKMGANIVPGRMTLENNCFFLRTPEDERSVFGGRASGMTVAQYNREQGVERANVVANPQFSAFEPGSDFAESTLFVDGMIGRFSDFNDLFVTNPDLAERGIGLQPDAFADFHFNKAE